MLLQRYTDYILKHRWMGLLITLVLSFIPMLGMLGIIIAALVTLRKGIWEGALYTVAATLPILGWFYFSGKITPEMSSLVIMTVVSMSIAVLSNVLTWVFAVMLVRNVNWSQLLQIAALLGVLAVSIVHLLYPTIADWWGVALMDSISNLYKSEATLDLQRETISMTKQFATGISVTVLLFFAVMQLVMARWWQAIIFVPGMLRKELHNIRLSKLAGMFFALSLIFCYLGNRVALDIMPIFYLLFGAAGLSLIHFLFGLMTSPTRWFWIWVMYIAMIFTLPFSFILVTMLALVDTGFDIRKRV